MSYAPLDDRFDDCPKLLRLGLQLEHYGLQACAITYCTRHKTNGRIPHIAVARLGASHVKAKKLAAEMVNFGLWTVREDGDFEIVGFLDHNPSREQIEAKREDARSRKESSRQRRSSGHVSVTSDDSVSHSATTLHSTTQHCTTEQKEDPPIVAPTLAKAKSRRVTPIPNAWEPKPETFAAFEADGLNARSIVPGFVDYWIGEGKTKADWDAAFRNWVRRLAGEGKVPTHRAPLKLAIADDLVDSPPADPKLVANVLANLPKFGGVA